MRSGEENSSIPKNERPWEVSDKWNLSPLSWVKEVRALMLNLPKRVYWCDSTLREGEDYIGVAFSSKNKVEIAGRLAEIGVEATDVGRPTILPMNLELRAGGLNN